MILRFVVPQDVRLNPDISDFDPVSVQNPADPVACGHSPVSPEYDSRVGPA